MKKYKLKYLEKDLNAVFFGNTDNEFCKILTDSRKTVIYSESLFISLDGVQHDGHQFIDELYKKGVRSFIISKNLNFAKYNDASFLKVENSIDALQKLALVKRKEFNNPVIAITGSNGKTIVKEWLYYLLTPFYKVSRSPKSFNSQIGVPLSLWMIDENADFAIIEAGISQAGEMEKLESIIKPNIGILTNIGAAHQSNFKDTDQKLKEKCKLFNNCKGIITNTENTIVSKNTQFLKWSQTDKNADIYNSSIQINQDNTEIKLIYKTIEYILRIPFTDSGSIENAISCFGLMCYLNFETNKEVIKRFETLPGIKMRLETLDAVNNSILINDSYNSDINSLEIALDYLNQKKGNNSTVLIMSDIFQNSADTQQFYTNLSLLIKEKELERFIGIGNNLCKYKNYFKENSVFFKNTTEFLAELSFSEFKSSAILLKGARHFKFEEISKRLQSKSHESYLETDMNLMRENLLHFRSDLKPETKIMAMVKAFSYGSGYREVSVFLQHNKIDYLAVAYTDEGVELRNSGIYTPIMVMNPSAKDFSKMISYNLEPEIYSLSLLRNLDKEIKSSNISKFPIHLKINTGMNRLGIIKNNIEELCDIINQSGNFELKSIFSHLSGSDRQDLDYFTKQQIDLFNEVFELVVKSTGLKPFRHILNSAGILRFPEYQFEMVRLGIGLYGLMPNTTNKLSQVSVFKSIISQINQVQASDTIGYNRAGKLNKKSLIATIPVGYADGVDRRLGNGNWHFIINGEKAPTIGDICMDMCMVDISEIVANENDEVIVFGPENTICHMAEVLKTIPYEVITGISQRVKRIYTEE